MSNDPDILLKLRKWAARTKPFPEQHEQIAYERILRPDEARKLLDGFVPRDMDDKWFVLLRPDSLDFYRSWTGFHIYRLLVRRTAGGGLVAGPLLVNTTPTQHPVAQTELSIQRVDQLIQMTLASDPWRERY